MRRNCNLELRLVSPFSSSSGGILSRDYHSPDEPRLNMLSGSLKEEEQHHRQQQQLTIFYNGKMAVLDVTELQARNIIWLASREMEERSRTPSSSSSSEPSSPLLQSPLYSPNTGLSMKKSLQRFLEKRKNRMQGTAPYYHH